MDPNRELPSGTITFLFTDIEGSTRLSRSVGEERYASLLAEHRAMLRAAIADNDGSEFGTEGDAVFAAFRSASRAVSAAAAAQVALESHAWPDDGRIRVRIGIHTGEVAHDADGGYVGIALHRAARICAAGHGGQVLVSEATRALLDSSLPEGLALVDAGRHALKDFDDPQPLYQLAIPGLQSSFPPLRTLDGTPNNLPRQLTTFIGRESVVATAAGLLRTAPLLTLTGPGGAGKTRLGLKLAEDLVGDFPDGVFFVALAPVTDPEFVPSAIGRALGLPEAPGRTPLDAVIDHLRRRQVLLLLDNFEQVVPAAPIVSDVLRASPDTKVIVTSRAVLHIAGEQEYQVPPLEMPDPRHLPPLESLSHVEAVALFLERARAARPDFRLTDDNAAPVAELCRKLDGLPLAIELAAARVRLLPPQAILARLGDRLDLLAGSSRDLPERQRTLRGAIAWSYDLLEERARELFGRLSVFVGGWTLESAEGLCAVGGQRFEVLDGLSGLVDQSLVRQENRDGEPRFMMLETIREFGLEQLRAAGRESEVRERHARQFLDLAERLAPLLTGEDRARWLDVLETEHDNLRAAMTWAVETGEGEVALRLLAALWRFWQSRDHLVEGSARASAILAIDREVRPEIRARAYEAAGGLAWWSGDLQGMRRHYVAAVEISRELGDRRLLADSLYNLTFVYSLEQRQGLEPGEQPEGIVHAQEALSIYEDLGDDAGRARALWAMGNVRYFSGRGEYREAVAAFAEAHELASKVGDAFMTAWALHMLGGAEIRTGDLEAAGRHLRQGLEMMRAAGETTGLVLVLDDFADLALAAGDVPRSVRLRGAARALEDATGAGLAGAAGSVVRRDFDPGALSDLERERYLAEGRAMGLDAALELALSTAAPPAEAMPAAG